MLGVSQSRGLKLFGREIIFQEFQRMWSRYLIVTDGQTDRQFTVASPRSALASRGNNFRHIYTIRNLQPEDIIGSTTNTICVTTLSCKILITTLLVSTCDKQSTYYFNSNTCNLSQFFVEISSNEEYYLFISNV